ncbi:hypothetical protein FN846DRAFT_381099 [Sphaerosporella brunnea]|uniref:Uncharacterized protein n=1 Tax=Sphaerosporella brunnea TaxID=1250544 RepID=A0A5J5F5R4_9PEZI|nr:hypothetical protein FN846DRAFT_381099 [Sphaerosporella brunnea]
MREQAKQGTFSFTQTNPAHPRGWICEVPEPHSCNFSGDGPGPCDEEARCAALRCVHPQPTTAHHGIVIARNTREASCYDKTVSYRTENRSYPPTHLLINIATPATSYKTKTSKASVFVLHIKPCQDREKSSSQLTTLVRKASNSVSPKACKHTTLLKGCMSIRTRKCCGEPALNSRPTVLSANRKAVLEWKLPRHSMPKELPVRKCRKRETQWAVGWRKDRLGVNLSL